MVRCLGTDLCTSTGAQALGSRKEVHRRGSGPLAHLCGENAKNSPQTVRLSRPLAAVLEVEGVRPSTENDEAGHGANEEQSPLGGNNTTQ